jgi:orotate phosphoribosyltransferase
MDKDKIAQACAKILLDTKSILVNTQDPFTYTSGKKGPVYVDCRRPISFPEARSQLMDFGAQVLKDLDIDYIAGGETAGIPYAAFLSDRMNKPMLYVRKKPKGFGKMAQIEGHMEGKNPRVLIVEDLQNFGTSVKVFIDALRAAEATVEHSFVIFEYAHASSQQNMRDLGLTLHALCSWKDVIKVGRDRNYFDSATIASMEDYLRSPDEWAAKYVPAA